MIYVLIYLALLLGFFGREIALPAGLRAWYAVALILALFLTVGLRDHVGHDFTEYQLLFNTIKPLSQYSNFSDFLAHSSRYHGELGFDLIIALVKSFGFNFNGLLLGITLALLLLLHHISNYHEVDFFKTLFVFICLYFVYYFFSYLRLSLVALGYLWALQFVIKRNVFSYILSVSVLSFFHISALVLIPVYFFRIKITACYSIIFIATAFVVQNFDVIIAINQIFLSYDLFLGLNYYLSSTGDLHRDGSLSLTPLFFTIFYFLNLYVYRRFSNSDASVEVFLRSYLLGIFVSIAFIDFTLLSSRLSGILFLPIVILFPSMLRAIKSKAIGALYFSSLVGYCTLLYVKMIYFDHNYMLPYNSILGI